MRYTLASWQAKRDAGKPQGTLGAHFDFGSVPQLVVVEAQSNKAGFLVEGRQACAQTHGRPAQVVSLKPMAQKGDKSADGYVWADAAPESWLKALGS